MRKPPGVNKTGIVVLATVGVRRIYTGNVGLMQFGMHHVHSTNNPSVVSSAASIVCRPFLKMEITAPFLVTMPISVVILVTIRC